MQASLNGEFPVKENAGPDADYIRLRWPVRVLNRVGRSLAAAGLTPSVDGDAILRRARRRHGHPTALMQETVEGLRVRARSYDRDAGLSLFGRLIVRRDLERCIANQLAFERAWDEEPAIREQRIERPLFVVGLPRSGTTLMQRLLCCHDGARYIPFWEAHEPVPRQLRRSAKDTARRVAAGARAVKQLNYVAPALSKQVHPITDEADPEECYHLFLYSQLLPPGFDFARLTSYWDWFEALPDRALPYRMFKRQLMALQWVRAGEHLLLKSPTHMSRMPELLEVFPDARIVYMERDAAQSVASLASLVAQLWSLISDEVDLDEVGKFVLETSAYSKEFAERGLRDLPVDQVQRVSFEDFMRDPVGCASGVYSRLGYQAPEGLAAKMQAFMVENPREKHGKHSYRLADFGLDGLVVRERLAAAAALGAGIL